MTTCLIGANLTQEEQDALLCDLSFLEGQLPTPITVAQHTMTKLQQESLKPTVFNDNVTRAVYEFMERTPTVKEIGDYLAFSANYFCTSIDNTPHWVEISKYYTFTKDDFTNDIDTVADLLGASSISKLLPYWVYTPNK